MATTTPNYGWTVPTSTDLVKDGATAIETLGDAIDASLVDLRGGTTGQVLRKQSNTQMDFEWAAVSSGLTLISTTSFSAVASQSFNDVFSSTYTNYYIIFDGLTSGNSSVWMRLRVSGADDTGSNYTYQGIRGATSTADAFTGTSTGFLMTSNATASNQYFTSTIIKPNVATPTYLISNSWQNVPATAQLGNYHSLSTAYTGFTLIPITTGTITGTVYIYGLAK
jgi:hypothetical protein